MQATTSPYIYTDLSGLGQLKTSARVNQQAAIKEIAKQFESLFTHMMLKSMRDASLGDPIFDSSQSAFYRDMFDNQLALSMSKGRGLGLADTLARQLQQQIPMAQDDTHPSAELPDKQISEVSLNAQQISSVRPFVSAPNKVAPVAEPVIIVSYAEETVSMIEPAERSLPADDIIDDEPMVYAPVIAQQRNNQSRQEQFIGELWPHAKKAAAELDLDPEVLIAQAALETGWGRYVNKDSNGQSSFNLFNIKAGKDWTGKTVDKLTLEYQDGVPIKEKATFRAYDSYAESFKDYAEFLQGRERYQTALDETDNPVRYMQALQRAGYATDPNYADKVINIMHREWDVFDKYISMNEGGLYDV